MAERMLHRFRIQIKMRGTDGFMGILGGIAVFILARRGRKIRISVFFGDQTSGFCRRIVRNPHGIRTDVGNQRGRARTGQIDAFIQLLCDTHGASGSKPEAARSLLLECAGGKRSERLSCFAAFPDVADRKDPSVCIAHNVVGFLLVAQPVAHKPAVLHRTVVAGTERELRPGWRRLFRKLCCQQPVFFGNECLYFTFPFHDHAGCDRLYASRAEPFADFIPEKRTELISDQPVEDPPRLL